MPFSYTAPTHSKEDEEREYADLSPQQKVDIIDDVYGRNAEEIVALNEREITQQELDAFDEALENLPAEDNAEAAIAAKTVICPELVELETNPSLFLRRENYNPQKAAKRFAAYWNFRVDLLGNEKAFLPISLAEGGAYHEDEEILRMMRESPSYRYILPNDTHGRSVVYMEADQENEATMRFSRQSKIKYNFYAVHILMKQQPSISVGLVALYFSVDRGQFKLNAFDRIGRKHIARFVKDCTPIRIRAVHLLFTTKSVITDLILPSVKKFWSPEIRQRFFVHNLTGKRSTLEALESYGFGKRSTLEALESYGLCKAGLPECLGGTYEFNTFWVQEHMNDDSEND